MFRTQHGDQKLCVSIERLVEHLQEINFFRYNILYINFVFGADTDLSNSIRIPLYSEINNRPSRPGSIRHDNKYRANEKDNCNSS